VEHGAHEAGVLLFCWKCQEPNITKLSAISYRRSVRQQKAISLPFRHGKLMADRRLSIVS
jgi:hypothetical protein